MLHSTPSVPYTATGYADAAAAAVRPAPAVHCCNAVHSDFFEQPAPAG